MLKGEINCVHRVRVSFEKRLPALKPRHVILHTKSIDMILKEMFIEDPKKGHNRSLEREYFHLKDFEPCFIIVKSMTKTPFDLIGDFRPRPTLKRGISYSLSGVQVLLKYCSLKFLVLKNALRPSSERNASMIEDSEYASSSGSSCIGGIEYSNSS